MDRPSTRRGILSVASSVYNPLGFAAQFILPAKRILQDLGRKGLGWNTQVPDDDLRCLAELALRSSKVRVS